MFVQNYFNLVLVVKEGMSFCFFFLVLTVINDHVKGSKTICAILVEGIMGKIYVKLIHVWNIS